MLLNTVLAKDHMNPRYDSDEDSQIENAQVDALLNLLAADAFSAYPLVHGTDTDVPAAAHHAKTTSGDIDHALITNVLSDQHHTKTPKVVAVGSGGFTTTPTTTSTSYTQIISGIGSFDYGSFDEFRFTTRLRNNTSGESTYAKIQCYNPTDSWLDFTGGEVSMTGTGYPTLDTGWNPISPAPSEALNQLCVRAYVTAGTGFVSKTTILMR